MKACVTGATGFLGAHVARLAAERGDEVRVVYRNPERLKRLRGFEFRQVKADVLDYPAMRRAVRGADVLFHTAGYVGSSPTERVWAINARAPLVVVEAAAAENVRRVVVTSTISAIGPARGAPADERTEYPQDWLGLTYSDSKREGERGALEAGERHGVEVVVVNPSYVLGVPVDRSQAGETSTRIVASYLLGRLPAVVAAPTNIVHVEDAARGHLLAADHGTPGERYILGGDNLGWGRLVDRIAELSGVRHPVVMLPPEIARIARIREAMGLPGPMSAEGYELMGQDWRFSSEKAKRELGYRTRPLDDTLRQTIDWYLELIDAGALGDDGRSPLSVIATGMRGAGRLGVFAGMRAGQRLLGRRLVAGV